MRAAAGHKENKGRGVRAAISGRFRASGRGRVRRDRSREIWHPTTCFFPLYLHTWEIHGETCSAAQEQRTPQTGHREKEICVLRVVSGSISAYKLDQSWDERSSLRARAGRSAQRVLHCPLMVNISLSWPTGFATDHLVFDALIINGIWTCAFPAHAQREFYHQSF